MLPNERTVAVVLLALLLAQGFPVASAQTEDPDLDIETIVAQPSAIVDIPTTVVVTVRNVGGATPNGQPFNLNIFVGEGSFTDCLDRRDPNDPQLDPNDPQGNNGCNVQALNQAFGANEARTYTFEWVPHVDQAGRLPVWGRICAAASLGGSGSCTSPDENAQNNIETTQSIFVTAPAVDAVADREIPPHPGADIDSSWRAANMTNAPACPENPDNITRVGCKAKPGQVLTYAFDVRNLGNAPDPMRISIIDASNGYYAERGYRFIPSATVLPPIAPNATRQVLLTVEIPANATAGDTINVGTSANSSFRVSSGLNPAVSTAGDDPPLPSIVIAKHQGLRLHSNDTLRIANVSQPTRYNLTLNNTGNAQDTYRFKWVHGSGTINDSWKLPNLPLYTVPAHSTLDIDFSIEPPANATKGIHTIVLEVDSPTDNSGLTYRNFTVVADLQQSYDISGAPDVGLLSRLPAEEASFPLRIMNDGNWYDNVTLDLAPLPVGWSGGLSTRVLQVPPHGEALAYLNVTAPPNAPKGSEAFFFMNATSSGPTDKGFDQRAKTPILQTQVRILEGSNLAIQGASDTVYVDPGVTVNQSLRLTNTGNIRDIFNLSALTSSAAWGAFVVPGEVDLDPLESADVVVAMRAPSAGAVGETATATVTIRSEADSRFTRTETFAGRISGPDLFVESVALNTTNPYAGDPIEVAVVFGNTGNKAPPANATLQLVFRQGGVDRVIGERVLLPQELPGGIRRTERFAWNDTRSSEGPGVLLARIDPDDDVREIVETPESNSASTATTLRTFDIRVESVAGLTGRPGEKVLYSESPHVFSITYRGNQPSEPVKLTLTSENGWASSETFVNLLRDVPFEFVAEVQIPLAPGVAGDELKLVVVPTLRPEASLTVTTRTAVLDDVKPRIGGITLAPDSVSFGQELTITALVSDATGLRSVRAFVVTPQNETKTIPLVAGEGEAWTARTSFTTAGLHRVYVEAIDGSDAANANSTRDVLTSFNVRPGSAPTIKLADGQPSTIRTGGVVRLNITDPLGIARVTYTIRGIEYQLSQPYHIDASSFPAGPVNVTVKASNIYGAESTQRFDLVVDNTAPGIRKVTISDESPAVNADVTLRIETDASVQSVSVLIKRDGQLVETRSAVRKSEGIFELTFNPAEGEYVLDVSAKDSAGNTLLKEEAVVFSAKPASFLPMPSVMIVAAALVAVALVLRRRR